MSDFEVIGDSSDREAWLAARRQGIGASEAPAVLNQSPWSSAVAVYADKVCDPIAEDESERLMWGHLLEPVILSHFTTVTGRPAEADGSLLRSTRWPFLLCTLDGRQPGPGVVEVKNTQDRSGWSDGVPQHVWIQVQQQLAVTGWELGSVAVLLSGSEFKWADVKRDDEFIDDVLIPECSDFWCRVQSDGPPPGPDPSEASTHALRRLYPSDNGESVSLPGEFTDLAFERSSIKESIKLDEVRLSEIDNQIRAALKDASVGASPVRREVHVQGQQEGRALPPVHAREG